MGYLSNLKYDCDWRRWRTFLMQCWEYCTEDDLYLQHMSKREQVGMLIGYGHYCLKEHRKDNPLAASTIAGSFAGIRHSFRSNTLDTDFFDHRSVRAFKTATVLDERKNGLHNQISRRKFPITLGMVGHIARGATTTTSVMCATAIQLAFFCLLRVSEYVPNLKTKRHKCCHAMLAKDVLFEVQNSDGGTDMIDATKITLEAWPRVVLVKFTLRSMKNDKLRIGSTFWFRNMPEEAGINIVKVAIYWAILAQLTTEDYFMSYRRGGSRTRHGTLIKGGVLTLLNYEAVNKTIKKCAVIHGLNAKDYGTHSPRIGGACTLRAGNAPETMLQLLGKWRGDTSSWVYQEASLREFDRMQNIIRNPALFTIKDIKLSYEKTKRFSHSFQS